MKESLVKKIEVFANVAIIIVALVLGIVLVKKFVLTDSSQNKPKETVSVGSKINFEKVDWAKNGNTMLLVLSKDCRFCTESIPFYQKISQEIYQNNKIKLITIFPQDTSTAKDYLQANTISVNETFQANPSTIGVGGTPTILLINDKGEVTNAWFGKLYEEEEKKVFERIRSISNAS